jgi:cyanophycinase
MPGLLALVGGSAWDADGGAVQRRIVASAGDGSVLLVLTAAAYEDSGAVATRARQLLEPIGARVEVLDAFGRHAAGEASAATAVREAGCVLLVDGSALHLRSVLSGSRLWTAILDAHAAGAALVAAGFAATVVADPMVDPRGGAYTVGLGLVRDVAVLAHHDTLAAHLRERSVELVPQRAVLAGVDEDAALLREPDGRWHVVGGGAVTLYRRRARPERHDAGTDVPGLPA